MKTSPRLKAMWSENWGGVTNRSDKNQRRVSLLARTISLPVPNLFPTSQVLTGTSGDQVFKVSGLMGIIPPFKAITARFRINPIPSAHKPGRKRLIQTNPKSRTSDPTSAMPTHASGSQCFVGSEKAIAWGTYAAKTNQRYFSCGWCSFRFVK